MNVTQIQFNPYIYIKSKLSYTEFCFNSYVFKGKNNTCGLWKFNWSDSWQQVIYDVTIRQFM